MYQKKKPNQVIQYMITVGSLFAGIGGIELGLEQTGGFKTVWQVENNRYATKVLEKHWPAAKRWLDIRAFCPPTASPWLLHKWIMDLRAEWGVDLICGGFPCQDISNAGKRAGIGGKRSRLWKEFARIIGILQPRFVLVENVSALLVRGIDTVLGDLATLGYAAEWDCIPAAAVGAPHIRDRVFILGMDRNASGTGIDPQRKFSMGSDSWTQGICENVANSKRTGLPQRRGIEDATTTCESRGVSGDDGQGSGEQAAKILADASEYSRNESRKTGTLRQRLSPRRCGGQSRENQWAVEPNVGRVAHGVPFELDCLGRGVIDGHKSDDSEADATRIWTHRGYRLLRSVWLERELATASPRLYQHRVLASVPEVPYENPYEGWYVGTRIETNKELRNLWKEFLAKPYEEAQDLQQRLLERIRQEKRPQALASRVDRLKCTGKAVVPQVAELIGNMILHGEAQ